MAFAASRLALSGSLKRWIAGGLFTVTVGLSVAGWWQFRDRTHERAYRIGYQSKGAMWDVLNEAAARAGIQLEWVPAKEGPDKALAAKRVDLWPIIGQMPERDGWMRVSDPYLKMTYWVVTREGTPIPSNWTNARVARGAGTLPSTWAGRLLPGVHFDVRPEQQDAMEAACRGEVDAALVAEGMGDAILRVKPPACAEQKLVLSSVPNSTIWFGVGSTIDRGAIQTANVLRDRIGDMILDGRFASLTLNQGMATSGQSSTIFQYVESRRAVRLYRVALFVMLAASVLLAWQQKRLRRARTLADAANHAKSVFLANMSHEIRTPMNGVLGMAELMKRTPLSDEQREYVDTIWESGNALLTLMNDILDLAKVESGKMVLRQEPLDPVAELGEVLRLFRAGVIEKGLELRVEGPEAPGIRVIGDALRLRQIMANLLSNAVKFTERGGITVRLRMEPLAEDRVMLRFETEDSGIGISAVGLSELFEPFTQANGEGARYGGSGLGLTICRRLAEMMSGNVEVFSELGHGSRFSLTVPMTLAPATAAQDKAPEVSVPAAPGATAARVLVVEDNAVNSKLIQRMLEKLGCTVTLAEDGMDALSVARREEFDLVLMDWQMPGIDGLETTRRLKEFWPENRQIPVVAVTASAMDGDRARCLQAGMSDYLTKPVRMNALAEVVNRWAGITTSKRPARTGSLL